MTFFFPELQENPKFTPSDINQTTQSNGLPFSKEYEEDLMRLVKQTGYNYFTLKSDGGTNTLSAVFHGYFESPRSVEIILRQNNQFRDLQSDAEAIQNYIQPDRSQGAPAPISLYGGYVPVDYAERLEDFCGINGYDYISFTHSPLRGSGMYLYVNLHAHGGSKPEIKVQINKDTTGELIDLDAVKAGIELNIRTNEVFSKTAIRFPNNYQGDSPIREDLLCHAKQTAFPIFAAKVTDPSFEITAERTAKFSGKGLRNAEVTIEIPLLEIGQFTEDFMSALVENDESMF